MDLWIDRFMVRGLIGAGLVSPCCLCIVTIICC